MLRGLWTCAAGYTGQAVHLCSEGFGQCLPLPELRGCKRLQSCRPPPIPLERICEWNNTNCSAEWYGTAAGASCEVRCKFPFNGSHGLSYCPEDNTHEMTPTRFVPWLQQPACVMNCPDPRIVPPGFVYIFPKGYAEDANGNWRCAPGYAGKIFFNCTFKDGANCTMVKEPAGCLPLAM
ncbi:unnamed protein product, partial [Polarella glacialis]